MSKLLVIPDVHVTPGKNNNRVAYTGKLIADEQPDIVVCLGDWADMAALSSYDKGHKSHEGRRYTKDIDAANEALDILHAPIRSLNSKRSDKHKAKYSPEFHQFWGNHEERIDRAVECNSELEGKISKDDIKFKEYGWITHEFKESATIEGVCFSHYFASGVMGRPIGGENPASTLLRKNHVSCVVGHSHLFDFAERSLPSGQKIMAVVAGCLVDYKMAFASGTQNMWWSGITILDNLKDGEFDLRQVSLRTLQEKYGK